MKRVVVGLSGGVDSSVTAHLLQQEGYEVIGLFMRNWHDETVTLSNDCPWIDDSNDALLIAEQLGIPFQVLDLSKEYKERIVDYMFAEYEAGRTPNPDVLCNREIKFDVFLKAAMELGADFVATGHYCRKITTEDGIHHLLTGLDPNKDQSYFLCQLSQDQLSKALFPIGNLQKSEVRAIAKEIGLVTADKKDSQGLCFVGKISLPEFLQQKLEVKYGKIIEINELDNQFLNYSTIPVNLNNVIELSKEFIYSPDMGIEVEKHIGAHYYTIGQRKGLNIGGRPNPSFVIGIDTTTNTVYSGQKDEHPGLNKWALKIETSEMHWINPTFEMNIGDSKEFDIRIRYRQSFQKGTLTRLQDGFYILFNQKQRGITPGQFAAFYNEDELIGSGIISH
ncbi:tRNA 2-thiouridine(34) synthase MnmA [Fluviicola taffensis]|uniref:tRNA-specific 2-thiouridylase MnmA n=1 Tax=Fluviicola taffensis (strain DSM 16823 / NCIMB 13979 / RW262) TaxID=755732 RepID=F2IBS8_FLUTR|nr:tRNA 2-thiouridine(34) synthase MnmA [Fluviicola taffensis]AEA45404.1 tRNA (5-methylaminomethyl-2-thiouridylate)-methyltransferase [Fluviicola taffensis DSM 16823]